MNKKFILLILFITSVCISQDEIYLSNEFQKAYLNHTRSLNGEPGENYWQNKSFYKIDVSIITETRTVIGSEFITYYNNSPDKLSQIVIRLYQNWNNPTASRDWIVDTNIFTGGIKIKRLSIDNVNIDLNNHNSFHLTGTNAIVKLPQKLSSKSFIEIYIEWEFQLPQVRNLRMGRYDKATYFIGYWYPQIAVYDDIYGWDLNEYTGTTEFYNDFSDFEVTISIDENNAIVWSTGKLLNQDELFSEKITSKLSKAFQSDTIIQIITPQDYRDNNIFKNTSDKRKWHFMAKSVPDFAFCFSNNYLWDATSVEVENGRRVVINSVYKQDFKIFDKVVEISKDFLKFFSDELPNVPFPYPAITIFNGAGGMEFPMMVNQSETSSFEDLVYVTTHEIAHTYFPFYMGINERLYAWMDEGWAVFIPMKFQRNYTGIDTREKNVTLYKQNAGTTIDLPLMVPSNQLRYEAYRFHAYNKSAFLYDVLMSMLGETKFKYALREYIDKWNNKHPTPYDFIFTFNKATGKDLNWFWKRWLFEFSYSDLAIINAYTINDVLNFEVHNKGNLPIPLCITLTYSDGTKEEFTYSPEIWENSSTFKASLPVSKRIKKISIGNKYLPDCYEYDNNLILTDK
ncbi:MAG: M1 family metallopeptidase [Ignavibacteria bacterium]|nr:M1 family metallopeptidase [Ignavibacteria bacterium]